MSAYRPGDRVRFLGFGEPDAYSRLEPGELGTVDLVDDAGTVHVMWDDGHRLGMVLEPPQGRPADRLERCQTVPNPRDDTRSDETRRDDERLG